MIELNTKEITTLVRCENENCGGVYFAGEVEQRDWKCPYCGRPISKLD
jgi:aspartate carbamoyltransferase regulatory subunit